MKSIIDISFKRIFPNDIPRACLPLVVANPKTKKSLNTYGIIDTGADECAFPPDIAKELRLKLKEGAPKVINTGNGRSMAYSHKVSIDIQGCRLNNVIIDFLPNLHIPLIGVKSFLSKFILIVDYPKKKFSLKAPKA
ncbi:hypothetical protein MNBD_UNCLBAC01-1331 [hydrothermal vent metagenome]|uniref:Peptidase A2 domain-containing protein n=1 Tax=hydrothermal vent metagenome TaxID=652676 RepID=A0A3B1D613_9ZZZZ